LPAIGDLPSFRLPCRILLPVSSFPGQGNYRNAPRKFVKLRSGGLQEREEYLAETSGSAGGKRLNLPQFAAFSRESEN
jgi:hypothetical protein